MTGEQFGAFLREHLARHHRGDWPGGADATVFFGAWLESFRSRGVTPAEADEASRHLAAQGGDYPDRHLGRLVESILARRRDREVERSARRRAAERAAVEAEVADEARLRATWQGLDEAERERLLAEVRAEHPGLVRWGRWVERLAMERAANIKETV